MRRTIFDDEHDLFRASVRQFLEKEVVPHIDSSSGPAVIDRECSPRPGPAGSWAWTSPEALGGGGVEDFRTTW